MKLPNNKVEIISAPSILGLKLTGVEKLAESLLTAGLKEKLGSEFPVIYVPTLNYLYSDKRDEHNCLNSKTIKEFSITLSNVVMQSRTQKHFPLVLGGDCSILLGIMSGLKQVGELGLIFFDAHADFYEPEKSVTGEVADMDLAIITGRGPHILTDINHLKPYVRDSNVIHVGQRDWEQTKEFRSQDIRETSIKCFDLDYINSKDIHEVANELVTQITKLPVEDYWIHFDTDVLSDALNPAVDYRLPGGLSYQQITTLFKALLSTSKIAGMSVSIFNPTLDREGKIALAITDALEQAFTFESC